MGAMNVVDTAILMQEVEALREQANKAHEEALTHPERSRARGVKLGRYYAFHKAADRLADIVRKHRPVTDQNVPEARTPETYRTHTERILSHFPSEPFEVVAEGEYDERSDTLRIFPSDPGQDLD